MRDVFLHTCLREYFCLFPPLIAKFRRYTFLAVQIAFLIFCPAGICLANTDINLRLAPVTFQLTSARFQMNCLNFLTIGKKSPFTVSDKWMAHLKKDLHHTQRNTFTKGTVKNLVSEKNVIHYWNCLAFSCLFQQKSCAYMFNFSVAH